MSESCLFVVGVSHHQAPLEVRERLAPVSEEGLRSDIAAVPGLGEFAMLSTCNRIEIYGVASGDGTIDSVQSAYCARQRFDPLDFERIRFRLTGREAALHLFEVASGIDSQLVGENEILGQVKDAYATALASRSTGVVLNRMFQKAFQAAKHVRTHTGIASGQVSIASVAVDLAFTIFGSVKSVRTLVLGTGEIGEATARAFRSRGAASLAVAGRTQERAAAVAAALGAEVVPFGERDGRMADHDIVVCSTAAPETVVSRTAVATAMRRRPARPLLLIDLALPRDVESSVADLQNVFLYNLDDLAKIAERNRTARLGEIARCRELLAQRVDGLWAHLRPFLSSSAARAEARREPGAAGHPAAF